MNGKLILASGSPRRAKILRELGVEFVIERSDAPEVAYPHDPERTVRENAVGKGAAVRRASGAAGSRVLSADTIVWFDGRIFGKPKDLREAKEFLRTLSGRTHTVFTGVACDGDVRVVRSDVRFRELSEPLIDAYVARVKPVDRAGAYDIDESGDLIVESYTGSYENIMGLPVEPLREWGLVPMRLVKADDAGLEVAVKLLCSGGVAVIPTDTVYGLAAHPDFPAAVGRLYTIKARAGKKPIALLASDPDAAARFVGADASRFGARYWPGALTVVSRGEGVRIPDHVWTRELLRRCGGVLRVTSANMSGRRPATDAGASLKDVGLSADLVVDGGVSPGGVASTVVSLDGGGVAVLREGPVRIGPGGTDVG